MSTRIPVPHPAQKHKHNKSHKRMPTMQKEVKLNSILDEKRDKLAAPITNRANFLHNTAVNNTRNEVNRLLGLFSECVQSYGNDGRFTKMSDSERKTLLARANMIKDQIEHTHTHTPLS